MPKSQLLKAGTLALPTMDPSFHTSRSLQKDLVAWVNSLSSFDALDRRAFDSGCGTYLVARHLV